MTTIPSSFKHHPRAESVTSLNLAGRLGEEIKDTRRFIRHILQLMFTKPVSVGLALSVVMANTHAEESITGILTDFGGFYESYEDAVSSIKPNAAHNLIGFQQGGTIYSTGVNDQLLVNSAISFTTSTFKALVPFSFVSNNVGQGALDDGSSSSATGPVYPITSNDITAYMTDGINGLGMSTFGNNVGTTINFNVSNIKITALNDPAPEFIYFNNAVPSGSQVNFKLFNASNVQLGVTASSVENSHPSIANLTNDRFKTTPPFVSASTNQSVSIQGFTLSLTDFDVTAAELSTATRLEVKLPNAADPPFIAYNADSLLACAVGDADNDRVCDLVEGSEDSDDDGINDDQDTDSDNDSIPDIYEGTGDVDGDTVPNYLDLDSDGDGIVDSAEDTSMPEASGIDSDSDGIDDIYDVSTGGGVDVDGNGFIDSLEPTDSDSDGTPDFLDNDSDGDGILDIVEGSDDTDTDSLPNYLDLDSDADGINDSIEGATDDDADTKPNFIDTDSDDDGIDDSVEGVLDTDSDTTPNYLDTDSDGDGIDDNVEGSVDADNDTFPNYVDTDSDDDGIDDSVEGVLDTDSDTTPNYLDTDSDGDGISDAVEGALDSDGDGLSNAVDIDANNDGIPDMSVGNGDTDTDGVADFLDSDIDGDGIANVIENSAGDGTDTDNDGTPDYLDTDSDNDGISDDREGSVDTDGDSIIDAQDIDSDNDGLTDRIEGHVDTDDDGVVDALDRDSDNDGILDALEVGITPDQPLDTDGDGIIDARDLDSDNDGLTDTLEANGRDDNGDGRVDEFLDTDNDGVDDAVQAEPLVVGDFDADGIRDFQDLDSDNDGLTDTLETQGSIADADRDGRVDGFTDANGNGLEDSLESAMTRVLADDTDGDGVPDYLDRDTDGDGILDLVEAGGQDLDNDGIVDSLADTDNDGIPNSVDVDNTRGNDADSDGIDDSADIDFNTGALDTDSDGIIDRLDPDLDGDGLANFLDDGTGHVLSLPDTDSDGVPDVEQVDSPDVSAASPGVARTGLSGSGCAIGHDQDGQDPLLLLLMVSAAGLFVRRRTSRRIELALEQ